MQSPSVALATFFLLQGHTLHTLSTLRRLADSRRQSPALEVLAAPPPVVVYQDGWMLNRGGQRISCYCGRPSGCRFVRPDSPHRPHRHTRSLSHR